MYKMINILYEDLDIIVVEKPIGISSQKDKTGDKDLQSIVCELLNNNEIRAINRLDRPVGGLILFGKNQASVAKLSQAMINKEIEKQYLAVVCGLVIDSGELQHYLIKNQKLNVSKAVHKNVKNSKEALLRYKKIAEIKSSKYGALSLLKINLLTGRHHQIRVQFSHIGYPIWGDTKYNLNFKRVKEFTNIALWSYSLSFWDYRKNKQLCFKLNAPQTYPFNQFDNFINK